MYEQNDLINSFKFFFNIKKVSSTFGVLSQWSWGNASNVQGNSEKCTGAFNFGCRVIFY